MRMRLQVPSVVPWRTAGHSAPAKLTPLILLHSIPPHVQVVVENANAVNSIQYILMAADIGVAAVLIIFVLLITARVSA